MGCSNGEGERVLSAVLESITDAMRASDRIVLTGFGSFELTEVKARKVRPIRGAGSEELIEIRRIRACASGRERSSHRWRGSRRQTRKDTHPILTIAVPHSAQLPRVVRLVSDLTGKGSDEDTH